MNKGNLFIISGPSGSGKDTVLAKVFEECPKLKFSISTITRPMREGEKPDGKYRFVSVEEFENMIKNDMLLEYNNFVGNYYGTPRKYVEDNLNGGYDVLVEVDVNGAKLIREKMPEAISLFICPPSFEVLKARLSGRGTESAELVEKRLEAALGEISRAKEFDYVIINDKLEDAVRDVVSVIKCSNLKVSKKLDFIDEIIKK
ncbi:MAG: guanylate kinase [Clostridia bacterium]|nr:guanylate kinase [Clostridia bacterium]